ncbi:MAG: PAS domain S-box protein [Candidatus Dadabacteria bacterium]|nr:MAG: PAS domain S-box protein [Candidatus Dadabacteria bacterium]
MLQEYFERTGYSVEAYANAEASLAAAARAMPQLAVIDTALPGMSGLDACRAIRALPGGGEVYILALTTRDAGEEPAAVMEAGANDYLVKPIDRKLLRLRLGVAASFLTNLRQRNHALAALERADARYRLLAEHSPDLVWQVDASGRLRYVSPAIERLLDMPLDAALQMPLNDLFVDDDQDALKRTLSSLLNGTSDGPALVELRVRHPDGPRWTETRIHVASRSPLSLIGVTRDISDRRKVQQQALERQLMLERVAAAVPGVLYLFDLQAQRSRLLSADADATSGLHEEADPLLARMHPEDYLSWMAHVGEHAADLDEHDALRFQYRLQDADGEWRTYETREVIFDFDATGRVRTLLGLAVDPSELSVLERERVQARATIAALLALQPCATIVCDEQGWILWQNDAAAELLGVSEAEAAEGGWRAVVGTADTAQARPVRLIDSGGRERATALARITDAELDDVRVRVLMLEAAPGPGAH